jgi:hypothetical protein
VSAATFFCCFQFGQSLIFNQSTVMSNKYLVAPHLGNVDEAHESKHDSDALPRRFDELPDDLQHLVRKHTAANFFVEWHTYEAYGFEGRPLIIRYEFKLQRRQGGSGPMMMARITRRLDSLYRQHPHVTQIHYLEALENYANTEEVIQPFIALQVKMHIEPVTRFDRKTLRRRGFPASLRRFRPRLCFVRVHEGPYGPVETVEVQDWWSECPEAILSEIGEKLRTVFGIELTRMENDPEDYIDWKDYYDSSEED